jgi:arsenate reductase
MADFTIYHNPRCSKSRQTLAILNEKAIEPTVIEYLKAPPSKETLKATLAALNLKPQDIMRQSESEYKESGLNNPELSEDQQLELMHQFPKVIQRPIVVSGKKAVIGRPPENVLELL